MNFFKLFRLWILEVLFGIAGGWFLRWGAHLPGYQNELFFYAMLVGCTFLLMVATARVLGTKSWDEIGKRKLFTRRFAIEVSLMCGFVLAFYPVLRHYELDRELSVNTLLIIGLPIYGLWINQTLKRMQRGQN